MEKICVLMATYNPTEYLLEQIDSIYNQKNVEVDLVIRDDASTDKRYLEDIKNRFQNITIIFGQDNLGVAGNIRELLKFALNNRQEIKFFAYSDQDDVWLPEKLAIGVSMLKTLDSRKPGIYYSNLSVVDQNLIFSHNLFREGIVKNTIEQSLAQVFLFACTTVFNFNMLKQCLEYDFSDVQFDMLVYYLGIANKNIVYDDEPHILYRQHGNNVSGPKERGIKYLLHKTVSVLTKRNNRGTFKCYATYIKKNMCNLLSKDEVQLIDKVANYDSLWSRIKLIFDSDIKAGYYPKDIYRWLRLICKCY